MFQTLWLREPYVVSSDEEANAVGPAAVALRAHLHLVAEVIDEPADRQRPVVRVPRVQALGAHPAAAGGRRLAAVPTTYYPSPQTPTA